MIHTSPGNRHLTGDEKPRLPQLVVGHGSPPLGSLAISFEKKALKTARTTPGLRTGPALAWAFGSTGEVLMKIALWKDRAAEIRLGL